MILTKHGVLSVDGVTRSCVIRRAERRDDRPILEIELVSLDGLSIDSASCDETGRLRPNESLIREVIFNYPATVVIWKDGTKTVVKCQPGDVYSNETGLAMCIAKKYLGNKGNFNEVFKKYIEGYDPREN